MTLQDDIQTIAHWLGWTMDTDGQRRIKIPSGNGITFHYLHLGLATTPVAVSRKSYFSTRGKARARREVFVEEGWMGC